jgi:hypothetical protein
LKVGFSGVLATPVAATIRTAGAMRMAVLIDGAERSLRPRQALTSAEP